MTDNKPLYDPELIRAIRKKIPKMMEEFYYGAREQEQRMVDWYKKQKKTMTDHPITYETIFIDLLGYKEVPPIVLQEPAVREDYIVGKFSASFVLEIAQLAYDKGKQDGGNEHD